MSLILIVEDEPGVRQTITDWLESEGYQVASAGTAGEALAWLAAAPRLPDAALLDIKLPGINGFRLADLMEEEHGFAKVIFITAFFWEDETRSELARRGKPYFEKPLKFHREVLPFLGRYLAADETE